MNPQRFVKSPIVYATVPRICEGGTVVCLGGGPSLTPEDVEFCEGKATIVCVNDTYRLAPFAQVLYAADARWWVMHTETRHFPGLKYSVTPMRDREDVAILRNTGLSGLEHDPSGVRTGANSGYQALNVAVHLGATTIVLLGYDMQMSGGKRHWFGEHPPGLNKTPDYCYPRWRGHFGSLVEPLQARGVKVINCSRETALTCFPRASLEATLAGQV